ncbi:hypothetical protein CEXT_528421 [Caerostris extrusa]|uniref:Uncharacterized protein n=1 Tax=Caerostris extrusa TaxID=172846 RepID=A0AAV4PN25_CAEEX|nr:hypothetical protein CEXT_528421 [Caerostris extrusa]
MDDLLKKVAFACNEPSLLEPQQPTLLLSILALPLPLFGFPVSSFPVGYVRGYFPPCRLFYIDCQNDPNIEYNTGGSSTSILTFVSPGVPLNFWRLFRISNDPSDLQILTSPLCSDSSNEL